MLDIKTRSFNASQLTRQDSPIRRDSFKCARRRCSTTVFDDGARRRATTALGDGALRRCSAPVLDDGALRSRCSTTVLSVRTNLSQPSRRPVPCVRLLIVAFHARGRAKCLSLWPQAAPIVPYPYGLRPLRAISSEPSDRPHKEGGHESWDVVCEQGTARLYPIPMASGLSEQ